MMLEKEKTFALCTLGCKVNQEEGAAMAALLSAAGYRQVAFSAIADIYIINTCTVTHVADRKCRAMIRRAVKTNAEALVVVAGCYAQISGQEAAAIEGVDLVIGVDERASLLSLIEHCRQRQKPFLAVGDISKADKFMPIGDGAASQNRARAYLKIEDGCDQFCHYCLVPYARGPVRSLPLPEVVEQAQALLAADHKEIVLTGIHIGAYGQDLPGIDLQLLLQQLLALPGDWRLRLGSLEPQQIDERLIKLVAGNDKICKHLHIPLQAGSDKILAAMGRHYDTAFYAELLQRLRASVPDIAITSDVMVGYPGESEKDFADSYDFCRNMAFAGLHIFPYSPRQQTVAATLSQQVPAAIKENRAACLAALAQDLASAYGSAFVGRKLHLLLEQKVKIDEREYWQGHSENYLPLYLPCGRQAKGSIVPVIMTVPYFPLAGEKKKKNGFFCREAGIDRF